jgi:hypothetical protein
MLSKVIKGCRCGLTIFCSSTTAARQQQQPNVTAAAAAACLPACLPAYAAPARDNSFDINSMISTPCSEFIIGQRGDQSAEHVCGLT